MDTGKVIALTRRMIKKELSDLGPYHYVGTVADVNELPLTANVGDVYNVGTSLDSGNYVWNGTEWDSIGDKHTAYEPLLRFDPTPVYDVTLAEDVATSSNTPYSIPLATAVPAVFVFLQTAKASGSSQTGIIFKFAISDTVNTDIQVVKSSLLSITYPMYGCAFATVNFYGVAYAFASSGRGDLNGLDGAWSPTALPRIVTSNAKITKIDFWAVNNDVQIPAGTQITVYVAKEAE